MCDARVHGAHHTCTHDINAAAGWISTRVHGRLYARFDVCVAILPQVTLDSSGWCCRPLIPLLLSAALSTPRASIRLCRGRPRRHDASPLICPERHTPDCALEYLRPMCQSNCGFNSAWCRPHLHYTAQPHLGSAAVVALAGLCMCTCCVT